ncbi:MAG: MmgE/PrpD family protein, partial [Deltaproteobacteria bacterium]|nr:MmgE/PrpD family protein [Deltaproteobacteria bacterium]
MPNSATQALARFVVELEYERIPESTIRTLKDCILDTIGCGLHGSTTKEGLLVAKLARDWSEKPESTLWGAGQKTACANAVLANSTMIESFALDDIHHKATLHPGCATIPVAFTLAEALGKVDGKKFLTAVTAGYEAMIRAGMSVVPSARLRGFHPVSICAPFGSAVT